MRPQRKGKRKWKETPRRKEFDDELWEMSIWGLVVLARFPRSLSSLCFKPGWVLEFQTWTTTPCQCYTPPVIWNRRKSWGGILRLSNTNVLKWGFRWAKVSDRGRFQYLGRTAGRLGINGEVFMQIVVLGSPEKRTGRMVEGHRILPTLC